MSQLLKGLAAKYEAYDQGPHPFGDGYSQKWKRFFVLTFQTMLENLPNGAAELEQCIATLERPRAPNQVGPAIISTAPNATPASITSRANVNSTAMTQGNFAGIGNNIPGSLLAKANTNTHSSNITSAPNVNSTVGGGFAGNANNIFNANEPSSTVAYAANPNNQNRPAEPMNPDGNHHDASHPNNRFMTQPGNSAVLPLGTIFKVDTQSDYTVRVDEGAIPKFLFNGKGPGKVYISMEYLGGPPTGIVCYGPIQGHARAPGATVGPGGSGTVTDQGFQGGSGAPGTVAPFAPSATTSAPGAVASFGNVTGPGGAVPANGGIVHTPYGAVVAPGSFTAPGAAAPQASRPAYYPSQPLTVPADAYHPPAVATHAPRPSQVAPDVGNAISSMGSEGMDFHDESSI